MFLPDPASHSGASSLGAVVRGRIVGTVQMILRNKSRLHHIGIGRRYAGTSVLVAVHDLHIRLLSTSGRLLRGLTLDPTRDYQPQPRT
jgi:hypothetical protein